MPYNHRLYSFDELLRKGIFDETIDAFVPVQKILVPKIQRPYAQGRLSQLEIRINFLEDIFEQLSEPEKILELNFVYGSLSDGTFELLDGQQRLTTLFLLSWYLALGGSNVAETMSLLGKFTYETRTTSSSFIKKLLDPKLTLDKLSADHEFKDTTPAAAISNLGWYTGAYSKDSTVAGMLVMLDAIDARCKDLPIENRPTYSDLSRIMFYLLDLENLGLTDELFIKMNARGLQLTPFENFKAELSGWLRNDPMGDRRFETDVDNSTEKLPLWLFFCSNMDGRWNDRFWTKPNAENLEELGAADADRRFFTFIKRWLANRAVTLGQESPLQDEYDKSREPDWVEYFRYFNEQSKTNRYHSFGRFRDFATSADAKGYDIIAELTHFISCLADPMLGKIIDDAFVAPWTDKGQKPWDNNFDMRPMIIFSAISEFVISQPYDIRQPLDVGAFDRKEFKRWMRMVHNVVENRNIDGERPQLGAIRQLKGVLNINKKPVYQRLLDFVAASPGESNREFREEAAKIKRIFEEESWKDDSQWENAFIEAERNRFVTGSVSFYLDDTTDIETFRHRTGHLPILFNENGVEEAFSDGYQLWRAILARDVDWSSFKFDSYNIRLTNKVSGNRFLKMRSVWNESPRVRRLFCELLDKETTAEMQAVIDNVAVERNEITFPDDWNNDVRTLSASGLSNLCNGSPQGGALSWLSAIGNDGMGVKFYRDGVMALYHGYINCMYLNNDREKFIPALVKSLEDAGFSVRYRDHRFKNSLDRFGLYSGWQIEIYVTRPQLPGTDLPDSNQGPDEYLLSFSPHFALSVYASQSLAKKTSEMVSAIRSNGDATNLTHIDSEDGIIDDNGNHITYTVESRLLYLSLYIPDIRSANPANILRFDIEDSVKDGVNVQDSLFSTNN